MAFPSSPTPGPFNLSRPFSRHRFFSEPETDENDPSSSYPTPPVSDISIPPSHRTRPRTRQQTNTTPSNRYRQPTLSECLSRRASSPSSDAFSTCLFATSSVLDEGCEEDHDALSSQPPKRARLSSVASSDFFRLSPDPSGPSSDWMVFSDPICPIDSPVVCKSRIVDESVDLLSEDRLSRPSPPGRFPYWQALRSCPDTQTIKLWNDNFEKGYEYPFSLTFNHAAKTATGRRDGQLLAVASAMGTISFYNPYTQASVEEFLPVQSLQAAQNGIFALSFSQSDRILATGSGSQESELFDVETGNLVGRLQGHQATVKAVEFSELDENLVLTGSRDGCIKIWDLRVLGAREDVQDVFGRKRKKGAHVASVSAALWSKHLDRHVLSAGSVNGVIKLWDIRKKTPYSSKMHPVPVEQSVEQHAHELSSRRPHGISSLTLSSDGARLYALSTDSTIRTHDTLYLSRDPDSQLQSFTHPSLIATSLYLKLAISACDQLLACGSSRGEIFLWNTADKHGQVIVLEEPHEKDICGLAFGAGGLASCADDGAIRIWRWER